MTNDMSLQESIQELKETGIDFADSMKEILSLIKATFSSNPWQVNLAAAVTAISFIASLIIRIKFNYQNRGERRVAKAKALGHMTTGYVDCVICSDNDNGGHRYTSSCKYVVDGKEYRTHAFRSKSRIRKGEPCTVYWINNPKHGFSEDGSIGFLGILEWLLVVTIPIVLGVLTLATTGGFNLK